MTSDGPLILNRDLVPADVPAYEVGALAPPDGGHEAAWAEIWRFAQSFDADAYAKATGDGLPAAETLEIARAHYDGAEKLGFAGCRAALQGLWLDTQGALDDGDAHLADTLLDAIYRDLSGGAGRPRGEPRFEPGLGTFGAAYGTGQHRFWLTPRTPMSREELFAAVAGHLLQHADPAIEVAALYLCPPRYSDSSAAPPTHVFMVLLKTRVAEDQPNPEALKWHYGWLIDGLLADLAEVTDDLQPHGVDYVHANELQLSISTGGHSYLSVEWRDELIHYECTGDFRLPDARLRARPTDEQWRAFWREVQRMGVWSWGPSYEDISATDGTSWSVQLGLPGRTVRSSGYDAFPEPGPKPDDALDIPDNSPVALDQLRRAALRLAGVDDRASAQGPPNH